jgi:hypothetical protein
VNCCRPGLDPLGVDAGLLGQLGLDPLGVLPRLVGDAAGLRGGIGERLGVHRVASASFLSASALSARRRGWPSCCLTISPLIRGTTHLTRMNTMTGEADHFR